MVRMSNDGGAREEIRSRGVPRLSTSFARPRVFSSQVKSIHVQTQHDNRHAKPIECAPEASGGGRESMEMAEGEHPST